MKSKYLAVFMVLSVGCVEGGLGETVEVREVELPPTLNGGLALKASWAGFRVPLAGHTAEALTSRADGGGSLLRLRVVEAPGAANGGLLREMAVERFDVGTSGASFLINHSAAALCQAADCPTPMRVEAREPVLLRDDGLLVAARIHSWGEPFEPRHRLLRFAADGSLKWSSAIDAPGIAAPGAVAELPDGQLVLARSEGSGQSSIGVFVELWSADGAVRSSVLLATTDLSDSGAELPAKGVPFVLKVVPSRDGGFFLVGFREFRRDIRCGSQDNPKPPDGTACGQSVAHGLLAKYDRAGAQVWVRELARDFEQPGSLLFDVVELEDGSLAATGHIEKRTSDWLLPDHGALVVRFTAAGVLSRATRLCPCLGFNDAYQSALLSPREVGRGGLDVVSRHAFERRSGLKVNAVRLSADDEVVAVAPLPALTSVVFSTAAGWGVWQNASSPEVNLFRFEPQ